jgi:hypothetical protein
MSTIVRPTSAPVVEIVARASRSGPRPSEQMPHARGVGLAEVMRNILSVSENLHTDGFVGLCKG